MQEPTLPIDVSQRDQIRLALRDQATKRGLRELPTVAGVDSIAIATRYLEGGRNQFIEVMQHAMLNNEPLAVKWWTVYSDLPPYMRLHANFDDITAAAGVEPAALCGVLVTTSMRFGRDIANMVAALMHPKVIEAQVRSASQVNGDNPEISFRDRVSFLQSMGFTPVPKGGTVVNVLASANAQAAAAASADPSMPSFGQDLNALAATPRPEMPALAAPAIDLDPLPAQLPEQDPIDV